VIKEIISQVKYWGRSVIKLLLWEWKSCVEQYS
jgi:hypothetical protein